MNAEINQRVQVGDLTPSGEIHYLFSSTVLSEQNSALLLGSPHAHIYDRYAAGTDAQVAADGAYIQRERELCSIRMQLGWGRGGDDAQLLDYTQKVSTSGTTRGSHRSFTCGQMVATQTVRRIISLHYAVEVLQMRCGYVGCPMRVVSFATGGDGKMPSFHYRQTHPIDPNRAGWVQMAMLLDAPWKHTTKPLIDCLVVSRIACAHAKICSAGTPRAWLYERDAHTL